MNRRIRIFLALAFVIAGAGCSGDSGGQATIDDLIHTLVGCGFATDGEGLHRIWTGEQQCRARCLSSLSCADLEEWTCGGAAASLSDEGVYFYPVSSAAFTCWQDCVPMFTCRDGFEIRDELRCDGDPDCADLSDETSCDNHMCGDGTLVYEADVCDGTGDCADFSDEANCPASATLSAFRCGDGSTVPGTERCNGVSGCPGGEDEDGCAMTSCDPYPPRTIPAPY